MDKEESGAMDIDALCFKFELCLPFAFFWTMTTVCEPGGRFDSQAGLREASRSCTTMILLDDLQNVLIGVT